MIIRYLYIDKDHLYLKQTDNIDEVLFETLGPAWFKHTFSYKNYIGLSSQINESYINTIASKLFNEDIFDACIIIQEDNLDLEYHSVQEDFITKYNLEVINEIQDY